jgi:murein DD-endopeptidase MepM/ murein hydrolase activator NlpD
MRAISFVVLLSCACAPSPADFAVGEAPVASFFEAIDLDVERDQLVLVEGEESSATPPRVALRAPLTPMILSSPFGRRKDPFSQLPRFHTGADFDAPRGATVYAAAGGVVVHVGVHPGFGREVIVDHGERLRTHYAHLQEARVQPGDVVEEGDAIASVGNTGRSTAPHLHFAVTDVDGGFLDPVALLAQGEALPAGDPRRALRVHVGDPMVFVANGR